MSPSSDIPALLREVDEPSSVGAEACHGKQAPSLITKPFAEVKDHSIDWTAGEWIARGTLTTLAADGGTGKTSLCAGIASSLSQGIDPFTGRRLPRPVRTLFLANEDHPGQIKSKLMANQGALEHIYIASGRGIRSDHEDDLALPEFSRDSPMLEQAIRDRGIDLVFVDPISDYLGKINHDAESEVRERLRSLNRVARDTQATIILIKHVNKGIGTTFRARIQNSVAYINVPRSAWGMEQVTVEVGGDDRGEDERACVLEVVKSNLGTQGNSILVYTTRDGGVRFGGPSPIPLDELMRQEKSVSIRPPEVAGQRARAMQIIRDQLAGGMKPATEVIQRIESAGISKNTRERAKLDLGVESRWIGRVSYWSLPQGDSSTQQPHQQPHPSSVGVMGMLGLLQPEDTPSQASLSDFVVSRPLAGAAL